MNKIIKLSCVSMLSLILYGCGDKNLIVIDTTNNNTNIMTTDITVKTDELNELSKIDYDQLNRAFNFSGITEFKEKSDFGKNGAIYIIGGPTPSSEKFKEYYTKESGNYIIIYDVRDNSYFKKAREFLSDRELIEKAKEIASVCNVSFDGIIKAFSQNETEYKNCSDTITYQFKGRPSFSIQNVINEDNTRESLLKSANNGDPEAQYQLAMLYYTGKNGLKQDYMEARNWLLKSAEQGNSEAQYQLAYYYYHVGFRTFDRHWDYRDAEELFKKSAKQGNIEAEYQLGRLLSNKNYRPGWSKEPQEWFKLACDHGHKKACEYVKE